MPSQPPSLLAEFFYLVAHFEIQAQKKRQAIHSIPLFQCFALFNKIAQAQTISSDQLAHFLNCDPKVASMWVKHYSSSQRMEYIEEPEGNFSGSNPEEILKQIVVQEGEALQRIWSLSTKLQKETGLRQCFRIIDRESKGHFTILDLNDFFKSLKIQIDRMLIKLMVAFFDKQTYKVTFDTFEKKAAKESVFDTPTWTSPPHHLISHRDNPIHLDLDTRSVNRVSPSRPMRLSRQFDARSAHLLSQPVIMPTVKKNQLQAQQFLESAELVESKQPTYENKEWQAPNRGLQFVKSFGQGKKPEQIPKYSETRYSGNFYPVQQPAEKNESCLRESQLRRFEQREKEIERQLEESRKELERLRNGDSTLPLTFRSQPQNGSLHIESISPIYKESPREAADHMKIEEFCLPLDKKNDMSQIPTGSAMEDKERRNSPKTPGRIKMPFGISNESEDELRRQTPIELLRKKVGESSDLESSFYEGFKDDPK